VRSIELATAFGTGCGNVQLLPNLEFGRLHSGLASAIASSHAKFLPIVRNYSPGATRIPPQACRRWHGCVPVVASGPFLR